MSGDNDNFLKELYKENSIFLHKVLFAVPYVSIGFMISFFDKENIKPLVFIIIFISILSFLASTIVLMLSFFSAEKAIDFLEEQNKLNKKQIKCSYKLIVVGMVFGFFGLTLNGVYNMTDSKEKKVIRVPVNDGLSIPDSMYKKEIPQKKGIPIPESYYENTEKNDTNKNNDKK
jgi:hypothetical protein